MMTHWTEEMFLDNPDVFEITMRRRVGDADEEVRQLLDLVAEHGTEPETALDVACGIGRHAVELGEAGVDVHGIDISPEYVDRARERANEAGVGGRASFEVADMRDLQERTETYDLVTNMWTAFGYFDEETNERVAEGLCERTAEDGVLVMELANKESMLAEFRASSAQENDGLLYVENQEYTPETGRMETNLRLFRTGGEEREDDAGSDSEESETAGDPAADYEFVGHLSWDLRLYGPAELRRLLERAGFSEVSLYGGLDGGSLQRDSSRLVVIAHH